MRRRGIAKKLILPVLLIAYILFLNFAAAKSWLSCEEAIILAVAGSLVAVAVKLAISEFLTKSVSKFISLHKKGSLLFVTAAAVAIIFLVCYFIKPICALLGIGSTEILTNVFKDADLFSYYTAQLSITFISISVLSVLSDKSVVIYWANVSEDRLIKPTFKCFAAYTYYSIGAAVGSGLGIILGNGLVFAAFFAVNTLVMIALTASMVDVYYGRDVKIKKLRRELCKDYYNSKKDAAKPNSDEYAPVFSAKYREKMLGLRQHLYNSYDNNDLAELKEMYELYAACPDAFYSKEGETAVKTIAETIDEKTLSLFVSSLIVNLNYTFTKVELEKIALLRYWSYQRRKIEEKSVSNWDYGYVLYIDKPLWKAISDSQLTLLIQYSKNRRAMMVEKTLKDLLLCVKKRVALIYNYEAIKKQEQCKGFIASGYLVDTTRVQRLVPRQRGADFKNCIETEKIEEMLSKYKQYSLGYEDNEILTYLLKITQEILDAYPELEYELDDFPYHTVLL